jgi:alpha-amylase/alpha-mannosidase (GH57 family)
MDRYVCIHGHFYQPPRENAWLEFVELQDSAYPFHDWNQRITAECYAPNGMSRILDGAGPIEKIANNYAGISFNFGPTLLAWMAEKEPETYRSILDADKESQARFSGHGSAIAQSYNHTILPLSNSRDKYTQLVWGIRDFEFRFGRQPEGMWLPETAADLEVLEMLAELGIRYTILSPYQAKSVRKPKGRVWRDVSGGQVDPSMPYEVRLASGKRIAIFFYDGPISQAIAFEHLLDRGENLANRLVSAFGEERQGPQLVHIATDGETYGHHHKHGEMALTYALHHIEANNLAKVTNYGEYLSMYPPTHEVEIWERSAWSCSHGVERWNSNCGCNSGGHGDWNQEWRKPLREALDWLRDAIAPRFEQETATMLRDPWAARNDYIKVILNRMPDNVDRFFKDHAVRELNAEERIRVLKLMEMQRHAMLMYTSCGWFFDELSGIETVQVIHYAARTLQMFEEVFAESLEPEFLERLENARSNVAEHKDGRAIYEKFVKPAKIDRKKVAAHYALRSLFEANPMERKVYCYEVDLEDSQIRESGKSKLAVGRVRVTSEITRESEAFVFGALHMGDHLMNAGVCPEAVCEDYDNLNRELIDSFNRGDYSDVLRTLDRRFGTSTYSLRSIFYDDQREILKKIMKSALGEAESVYRQIFETHAPMMRFVADLRVPLPRAFQMAAEFALNSNLRTAFESAANLDFARIRALLDEARAEGVALNEATLGFALKNTLKRLAERFAERSDEIELLKNLEAAAVLAKNLPFEVNVWSAQNVYYQMLQSVYPDYVKRASAGDASAAEWVGHFVALGENLSMKVERPRLEALQQVS